MNIESKECIEALKVYKTKNKLEELAVKLFTVKEEEFDDLLRDLSDEQFEELFLMVIEIRTNIGIEGLKA